MAASCQFLQPQLQGEGETPQCVTSLLCSQRLQLADASPKIRSATSQPCGQAPLAALSKAFLGLFLETTSQ